MVDQVRWLLEPLSAGIDFKHQNYFYLKVDESRWTKNDRLLCKRWFCDENGTMAALTHFTTEK